MGKGEKREQEAFLRDLEKWNRVVVKEADQKMVDGLKEPGRTGEDEAPGRQTFIIVECDTAIAKPASDAKLA